MTMPDRRTRPALRSSLPLIIPILIIVIAGATRPALSVPVTPALLAPPAPARSDQADALTWSSGQAPISPAVENFGLESLYQPGFLLDDRNGDGHLDYVNVCLALPATPSDGEVVAASNISARLGFETSSMDLPLRGARGGACNAPFIAIGAGALAPGGPAPAAGELEPGVGRVRILDDEARMVLVAGGDDEGTQAAAMALAAHLPYLWDPSGDTFADVTAAVRSVLNAGGVEPASITVRALEVRSGAPGLQRADLEIDIAAAQLADTERLLRDATEPAGEAPAPRSDAVTPGQEPDAAVTPQDDPDAVATTQEELAEELVEEPAEKIVDLRFAGLRLLRLEINAPATNPVVVWARNEATAPGDSGERPGGGDKADLDLSNLYTNDGFFSDTDGNLIPDRVDIVLSPSGDRSAATVDLAARLGLEATGVTIPIAKTADEIDDPADQPPLVLIGAEHPLIARLVDEEKLAVPELEPGQGWIGVVREAFDDKTALVVIGADDEGLQGAVHHLATTLPHFLVGNRGKDRPTVEDAEEALWRAISARSPIGQAATALYKLETLASRISDRDLERVTISVHVEKADPALTDFIRSRAAELFTADEVNVVIENMDVQNAAVLIDEEIDIPSEVDAFWQRFNEKVLPAVRRGEPVSLLALLSEPPEVRRRIAARARDELLAAGAAEGPDISILSAYKQGYSWLYDRIRPRLEGRAVQNIQIRFAEIGAPEDWPQQAMYTPTRWLLEIFPIDEVLARDMGLDLEQIVFEKMPRDAPAYEVIVTGPGGEEILRETFEPRWVLRDYFDRFPDYEKARVTTGWIEASVGGETVIDERIITDLERFWDHFQGDTLMRMYEHVMRISEGKPRASDAPHFGELRIDVTLSEPDYQIGVDQEQIASMEALHEEIYFSTLHFFDVFGRMARGQALNYPGRVIPIVRPKSDGAPGHAKITLTGFGAPRPRVTVEYRERGERPATLRRDIVEVTIDRPVPLEALIRDGNVEKLGFYVKVDFEQDRRDEFARRTRAESIDVRITNAAQTTAIIENAAALRQAGLYADSLAYDGLGDIELTVGWERERSAATEVVATLPRSGAPAALPDILALLPADESWRDGALVQWDTPMPPGEAYEILAKMQTWPEGTAYQVGESYLGKPIWAIDLMAPLEGSHWSQAKATTRKPTVIYSARQHANEVSSTSHVLKLGEIVLGNEEYPGALDKVNVVIHPITNPDGAQLAYDLYQITPNHMLHAGYLGALGVDVTSGQGSPDPMYPETNIRPKLWNTWLPDIFLNPHGYPSHEWVQVFSEYAGWVRNRATESRSWWGMRGWFMPGFSYLDDPRYPDHKAAAFEIRDRITAKINEADNIRALNARAYDRYRRYAFAWDQDAFKLDFTNDVLIYMPIKGGTGRNGTMSNPLVTVWSGTTEAPDETASGEWMELVATGGLQYDKALLEYLLEGNHVVERSETPFAGGMVFKIHRQRPPKPPEEEEEETSQQEEKGLAEEESEEAVNKGEEKEGQGDR